MTRGRASGLLVILALIIASWPLTASDPRDEVNAVQPYLATQGGVGIAREDGRPIQLAAEGTRPGLGSEAGEVSVSHGSYLNHESWKELFTGTVYTGNFFHVVGEVANLADTGIAYRVEVELYDSSGQPVAAKRFWRIGSTGKLAPGQKRPFLLILLNETASAMVERYEVSASVDRRLPWLRYGARFSDDRFIQDAGRVLGEVENDLDLTMENPGIYVTFYDSSGSVLGADYSYVAGATRLGPGQRAPFDVTLDYRPSAWYGSISHYSLYASYTESYKEPYAQLEVLEHRHEVDQWGWYAISGSVANVGDGEASFVQVAATLWDGEGILRCYSTYAQPSQLEPGGISNFSLGFLTRDPVNSYKLYVYCSSYAKAKSQISCGIGAETLTLGDEIAICGAISPRPLSLGEPIRETVTLHFRNPLGQEGTKSSMTDPGTATFNLSVKPDITGEWSVWPSWRGRDDLTNASGHPVVFHVVSRTDIIPVQRGDESFGIAIHSNCTIGQLSFREWDASIQYRAYYSSGWYWPMLEPRGSTSIAIPRELLGPPFTLTIDGQSLPAELVANSTHSSLSYHHPLRSWGSTIKIEGTIPELGSSALWASLLLPVCAARWNARRRKPAPSRLPLREGPHQGRSHNEPIG